MSFIHEPPTCSITQPRWGQDSGVGQAADVSVVVPTFNEAGNIAILVARVAQNLEGVGWEIVVVDDDSPDGTSDLARRIADGDRRVRIIQRIGRRGLASACIEGIQASTAPYVAVIDADLQHDETLLADMLAMLRARRADCVVGSRYLEDGEVTGWHRHRVAASRLATRLTTLLTRARLTDPMSGFFMIRRDAILPLIPRLSGIGFKILLDIVLTAPSSLRVVEMPYRFRPRERDQSKFDARAAYDFAYLIVDKTAGRWVPTRFLSFAAVGTFGLVVHLATVWFLFGLLRMGFQGAQIAATLVAMTSNFVLNNELTYRDRRLRGRDLLRGWVTFVLACSIGALANVAVATQLFAGDRTWWLASSAGILVGAIWNYAATRICTWSPR
jgi:dolichol-phosphate mannosyltransferase